MKNNTLLLLLVLMFPSVSVADELKPFTTDGCSAFPDGTFDHQSLWAECCIQHDIAYWKGGTYEERLKADKKLESCVADIGQPGIASLMLNGVRAGGSPYFPTDYRWGYGWPYLRGYQALSPQDKQQVRRRLEQFRVLINSIEDELGSQKQKNP